MQNFSIFQGLSVVKTVKESQVEMWEMCMPQHTNAHGTIFGGVVMSWIDKACAMVAMRHCELPVVTARIEAIEFLAPIKIGQMVLIKASLNAIGKTSLLVGVKVEVNDPIRKVQRKTTKAYCTFVALDDLGEPTPVPPLKAETEQEKRREKRGQQMWKDRKKSR